MTSGRSSSRFRFLGCATPPLHFLQCQGRPRVETPSSPRRSSASWNPSPSRRSVSSRSAARCTRGTEDDCPLEAVGTARRQGPRHQGHRAQLGYGRGATEPGRQPRTCAKLTQCSRRELGDSRAHTTVTAVFTGARSARP